MRYLCSFVHSTVFFMQYSSIVFGSQPSSFFASVTSRWMFPHQFSIRSSGMCLKCLVFRVTRICWWLAAIAAM